MNNLSMMLKNRRSQLLAVLLLVTLLAGSFCYAFTHTQDSDAATTDTAIETTDEFINAMLEDVNSIKGYEDYTLGDYEKITLNGSSISYSGDGAAVNGSYIVISQPGTYVISGTLNNGAVIVDSEAEENVRLVLNKASITCKAGAPVYVKNCGKNVVLSLVPGTTNSVTDGSTYSYAYMEDNEPTAAIFSNDDLRINGTGKLTVNANYNDGISCDDDLEITEAAITITSVDDGIVGKDSVAIASGSFVISAKGDAVKATNDEETEKGYTVIAGGTFDIDAVGDGICGESAVLITGGTFDITTTGGTDADTGEEISSKGIKAGMTDGEIVTYGGTFVINSKDDAVHSNGDITVEGGYFTISTGDDGMHADSILTVNDGDIAVTKSYEALEGMQINLNGGNIDVNASDDGINVAGGTSDQMMPGNGGKGGFTGGGQGTASGGAVGGHMGARGTSTGAMQAPGNVSGGAMQRGMQPTDGTMPMQGGQMNEQMNGQQPPEPPAQGNTQMQGNQMNGIAPATGTVPPAANSTATATTTAGTAAATTTSAVEQKLMITGGVITVNADGDGIDVNGSAYMTGGTVTVYGSTNNGNGALDYDGVFEVTGGELNVAGSSGMAMTPSSNTTVNTVATNVTSQKAGVAVKVLDANGKTVLTFTPEKAYSHIVVTSDKLVTGQTYTIMAGSTEVASFTAADGVTNLSGGGQGGMMPKGGQGGRQMMQQ